MGDVLKAVLHWDEYQCVPSRFSCVQLFATLWTVAARLLCPWDSPGENTGVSCHFILEAIFPIQGSNLGFLHCRQIPYRLSHGEAKKPASRCHLSWALEGEEVSNR